MRLLRRLLSFIIVLVIIILSVMNRHHVSVVWGPDGQEESVRLFFIFFAGIFFGLLAAAYATSWLRLKAFARARAAERRANDLEKERALLNQELTTLKADERRETHMQQSKSDLVSTNDNQ